MVQLKLYFFLQLVLLHGMQQCLKWNIDKFWFNYLRSFTSWNFPKTYHPMVCTAKVVHTNLPCMYLNIWVWTDVADILFASIPSPASITYSGFPVDKAILGQCGGPDLSTASFNYWNGNVNTTEVFLTGEWWGVGNYLEILFEGELQG